jgi:hypothetical protein
MDVQRIWSWGSLIRLLSGVLELNKGPLDLAEVVLEGGDGWVDLGRATGEAVHLAVTVREAVHGPADEVEARPGHGGRHGDHGGPGVDRREKHSVAGRRSPQWWRMMRRSHLAPVETSWEAGSGTVRRAR